MEQGAVWQKGPRSVALDDIAVMVGFLVDPFRVLVNAAANAFPYFACKGPLRNRNFDSVTSLPSFVCARLLTKGPSEIGLAKWLIINLNT